MPRKRRKKVTKSKNNGERNSNQQPIDSYASCCQDKQPNFKYQDNVSLDDDDFKQLELEQSKTDWQPRVNHEDLDSKHSTEATNVSDCQTTCSSQSLLATSIAGSNRDRNNIETSVCDTKPNQLITHVHNTEIGSRSVVSSFHDYLGNAEAICNDNNNSSLVGKLVDCCCHSSQSSSEISIELACYDSDDNSDNNYEQAVASDGHLFLGSQSQKYWQRETTTDKTVKASSNFELSNKSDIDSRATGSSTSCERNGKSSLRSKSNNWIESYRQHSSSIDFRRFVEKHIVEDALRQAKLYGRYNATSSNCLQSQESDSGENHPNDSDAISWQDFSDTESVLTSLAGSSCDDSRHDSQVEVEDNPVRLSNDFVTSGNNSNSYTCSRVHLKLSAPLDSDIEARQIQDSDNLLASLSSSLLTTSTSGCISSDWATSSSDCINNQIGQPLACPEYTTQEEPQGGGVNSDNNNNNNGYCSRRASSFWKSQLLEECEPGNYNASAADCQSVGSINFHSSDSFDAESIQLCDFAAVPLSVDNSDNDSEASDLSLEYLQSERSKSLDCNLGASDDRESLELPDHPGVGRSKKRAPPVLFSSACPLNARRHSIACDRYASNEKHLFVSNDDDDDVDGDVLCPHDNSDYKNSAAYHCWSCHTDESDAFAGYVTPTSSQQSTESQPEHPIRMKAAKDIAKISLPSLSSLQYLPGQLQEQPKRSKVKVRRARIERHYDDQKYKQTLKVKAKLAPATIMMNETLAHKQNKRPASRESCNSRNELSALAKEANTDYNSASGVARSASSVAELQKLQQQRAVALISCAPAAGGNQQQQAKRPNSSFSLKSCLFPCDCATKSSADDGNTSEPDDDDSNNQKQTIAIEIERQLGSQNSSISELATATATSPARSHSKDTGGRNSKARSLEDKRKLFGSVGNLLSRLKMSSPRKNETSPISRIKRPKSANDYVHEMPSQLMARQLDNDPARHARNSDNLTISTANGESRYCSTNSRLSVECNYPLRHRSLSGSMFAYQQPSRSPSPAVKLKLLETPGTVVSRVEFVTYGSDSQEYRKSSETMYHNELSSSASLLCYDTLNSSASTRSLSSLSTTPKQANPELAQLRSRVAVNDEAAPKVASSERAITVDQTARSVSQLRNRFGQSIQNSSYPAKELETKLEQPILRVSSPQEIERETKLDQSNLHQQVSLAEKLVSNIEKPISEQQVPILVIPNFELEKPKSELEKPKPQVSLVEKLESNELEKPKHLKQQASPEKKHKSKTYHHSREPDVKEIARVVTLNTCELELEPCKTSESLPKCEIETSPKTIVSAPGDVDIAEVVYDGTNKGYRNTLPAKIRAAFKTMGTAIWKSLPINVFLLILVAGMFVVPMLNKDACCELSNTQIPKPSQLSFTQKPI